MKQKKTVEDYLKAVYVLQKQNGVARSSGVADLLEVSRPTVCACIKELVREGYLEMDTAHQIHLTPAGQRIARATYERHQTFLRLLIKLGVDEKTAAQDACRMEHAVSAKSYRALRALEQRPLEEENHE
ncbi:MAG TPA: metal-dependent transcriptional regulator [Candidatus Gallacutalibacter stercoravium]|nr:metal-dependent transcriptional regulator [Candidatus Gallacutalibacter stercoravium]